MTQRRPGVTDGTAPAGRWGRRLAMGLVVAAALPAAAPVAGLCAKAAHDPWKIKAVRVDGTAIADAVGKCEVCHTLDASESESGTSYISVTARTLPWIKLHRGGVPFTSADRLACTFCHSAMLDNAAMEDALGEFSTTTIKHPVGRTVGGADTNNEWLSGIDSAPLPDELQCTSCHEAALLTYPSHAGATTDPSPWTGPWVTGVNRYALLNVASAGDADKRHCVETCHGDAVPGGNGATKPKMGHYTFGNFDGSTIYEPSGRPLRVAGAACLICHDAHTSTKEGLAQDGLKRGSPDAGRRAINENNCVAVCHDAAGFGTHGHGGRVGINDTTCAPCHATSARHRDQTDEASRRRMTFVDPVKSGLTADRSADGLDNDLDGSRDEADEAAFAYSRSGNCRTCHINYAGHGDAGRAAGCLDCHDVHGDDAEVNDNAAMIRSSLFGENTTFSGADRVARAFFKAGAGATGVCDNNACHRSIDGGLADAHQGGADALARPCTDCHAMTHAAPPNSNETFKVRRP